MYASSLCLNYPAVEFSTEELMIEIVRLASEEGVPFESSRHRR